jgi:hypothetical protein
VLGGDVQRPAGIAVQPEDGGRVHNTPTARLQHLLDLVLHRVKHALDVHVEQHPGLLDVLFVEGHLLPVYPGVVEGRVQPPELGHRLVHQPLYVAGLAHVRLLEDGPAPGLPDEGHDFFTFGGIPVADQHDRPGPRRRQRRRPADAGSAPGYDAHLVPQIRHRRLAPS